MASGTGGEGSGGEGPSGIKVKLDLHFTIYTKLIPDQTFKGI